MLTPAARAMNASSHTLGDLRSFAQADPTQAQAYLQSVKQKLVSAGRTVPPAVEALLVGPPDQLDTRIATNAAALAPYFPEQPQLWGQLQAQRVQTIGWTAASLPLQEAATGKLDANGTTLTLESGAVYNLALSSRNASSLPAGWLGGFRADGDAPITVRGTIGADGKTFLVEDYAPGSSADFTHGRVDSGNPGLIQTARGLVRVTDPGFLAQLQKLPRLGVILPGAAVMENNELVYKGNPPKFYALGRFGTFPGTGTPQAAVNLAQGQLAQAQANTSIYTTQIALFAQQLIGLQPVATTPEETAALANVAALEGALAAANAAQASALQAYTTTSTATQTAANTPQAAAANQAFADAQQAYTAAAAQVNEASMALASGQQAAGALNPGFGPIFAQRTSIQQQRSSYEQGLASVRTQIAAAQAALDVAQAALAAAGPQPVVDPNAVVTGARGDFAYSVFSNKPINIHGQNEVARANHSDRMWALGAFTFDAGGVPQSFEAEYLSLPLGSGTVPAAQVAEADDWLGAVAGTQAGAEPRAAAQVGADFDRHTP